ncbi:NUCLEIC ACID-BINDING OB-FOLD-LIKE PROTEIN [Salix viminalis]|uniref:NUCLEIC ACID-BINDING OB-FOLD-LIKE PROTEIN n=1 Tax=Salix viminalis TaxID=40686 RepID=A0A9Q0QBK4_SALVM|nr:NUCLEIC ACID-BINDING OB-FOLD-LIKE PROTEIN [Salix viminalis]
MDCLSLATTTATSSSFSVRKILFPSPSVGVRARSRRREIWFPRKNGFLVLAAKDEGQAKLDQWDQMELKFGHYLGEDPKLTLAKIMARKENPDVSFLEVEKSFYKNKGKAVEIKEVPFDVSMKKKPSNVLDGLNLVRPVPKEGFKFQEEDKPESPKIKKSDQPVGKAMNNAKRGVPNVILRKPSLYVEDDVEVRPSRNRVNILPNLTLKMGNDQNKEKFSDMTLLRKPRPMSVDEKQDSGNLRTGVNHDGAGMRVEKEGEDIYNGFTLLKKTETMRIEFKESSETRDASFAEEQEVEDNYISGRQPSEKNNIEFTEEEAALNQQSDSNLVDSAVKISMEAALQGKPKRLDHYVEATSASRVEDLNLVNPENIGNANEDAPSISPLEDADWKRAEDLLRTGDRVEVELISFSARGFIVSFGSLVGFLPYRNLAARWKFLAFESWLKQKGLDPSLYKKSLGIIGSYNVLERNSSLDSSIVPNTDRKIEVENKPDMKLEDLLMIYDQEKLKFLSSFVGQKIKVNVVIAERKLRKLVVSLRPKEKEELVEKKRHLMATLQIGDVVKCCIKKVTYFGIFVEVEGVPALIHASEVSWDTTLNPASCFKVGQIVEAKVHQLDFTLQRIFLSLKEITPDPLIETLESVFGGRAPLDGKLQEAEADSEWADVETLVKELQQIEGIQSVSRGRFFLSPGLAPAFQVYMASMFENQYKLLARSGNKVQEVIVQASLSKEEMKSTILSCANRVE